jgi:hypothetical protein
MYNTGEIIDSYFMSKVYIAEWDHSEVYPIYLIDIQALG